MITGACAALTACMAASPWLPWRNMVKDHSFAANHPAFQPVSALTSAHLGKTNKDELRQRSVRHRMQRAFEAGHGMGVLEPYEPPEPEAMAEPTKQPYAGKQTKKQQEEAQFPGRLHPPWWWEKPPRWVAELPWWLTDRPSEVLELPQTANSDAIIDPANRLRAG